MSLSNKCILEISELSDRAERLAKGSASERAQATVILQRIGNLRSIGLSSDEIRAKYGAALLEDATSHQAKSAAYRDRFSGYLAGSVSERELRDFLAGTQSITWTQGVQGGYSVPQEFDDTLRETNAQVDPLLDPDVTGFSMTPGSTFQPTRVSGYDLSTVSAQIAAEATQQTPQAIPTVAGNVLRSDVIFKATFGATLEAEEDIPAFTQKIIRASAVALARKIGSSVVNGHGGTDMTGLITQIGGHSFNNGTTGKITLTDILAVYFGVNRWYRSQKKCGWLCNDGVYKLLRAAVDSQNRPLLNLEEDEEELLGKPLYVSPSLSTGLSSFGIVGTLIFGDLDSLVIKCSRPTVQRVTQSSVADITQGKSAYIARARADVVYFDPSAGTNPPVVVAAIS